MKLKELLEFMVVKGLAEDVPRARSLLNCGLVYIGDKCISVKSKFTKEEIEQSGVRVKYQKDFVSRGAVKLTTVFDNYDLCVKDFVCMDIGASTGGFTELLLKKDAAFIYAIDVGHGLIDHKLRTNPKVFVMENINARNLHDYKIVNDNIVYNSVDLAVLDLSFISLKKVIPSVLPYIKKSGYVIPLIKPQFEAEKIYIEKGGIVKDREIIENILSEFKRLFEEWGLVFLMEIASKLKGASSGNQEYFSICRKR